MSIAIISGASGGIGQEFARALCARHACDELWLLGRSADRLAALIASLTGEVTCRPFSLDLTEKEALAPLQEALSEAGDEVTYLVAAAGVGYMGDFSALSAEEHQRMLMLNCVALTALIDATLPYMKPGAHILTLASAAAFLPQPHFAVYAATKAYVLSLSRALAHELKERGILVTAVCPGPVDTPFLDTATCHTPMPDKKKRALITPAVVVRAALRGAARGRTVVTPTLSMRMARLAAKLLPHRPLMRFFD